MDWYAMDPHMYVGDARQATAEKGKVLVEGAVDQLVALLRAVKADTVTPDLVREFVERKQKPTAPNLWPEAGA